MVKLLNMIDMIQNGQALVHWLNNQHVDSMIIASDTMANDPIQSLQLRLLTPKGMRVAVKDLYGAVVLLQSISSKEQSVAIITERIEDALFILEGTSQVEQVFLTGITGESKDVLVEQLNVKPME